MKKIINKITILLNKAKRSNFFIISVAIVSAVSGGVFVTYAEVFIDSFLDTSRVANTWNVEVDTANGEVKLAQRSCDNTVWFCDLAWRCPGTAGDGSQLLVKREDNYAQWKIWGNACDTPQCGMDGAQVDDMVADNTVDFSAYYPARQACKNSGARLPTLPELQCIITYKSLFGNNFANDYYWTSRESTNAGNAWIVYAYNGGVYEDPKTNNRRLRCVRGW